MPTAEPPKAAAAAARAPPAAAGFESLLEELDSLRARLLDQHRRELHEQRLGSGRAARESVSTERGLDALYALEAAPAAPEHSYALARPSVAEPEQFVVEWASGTDPSVTEQPSEKLQLRWDLPTRGSTQSEATELQTIQEPTSIYTVLDGWVSSVPIFQLAAIDSASTADIRRKAKLSNADGAMGSSLTLGGALEDLKEPDTLTFVSTGFISKWLMVHPMQWSVTFWSFLSLLLIAYDTVTVPLFFFYTFAHVPLVIVFVDWLARVFWTLDIPLSLVTGFHKEGYIEMRFRAVAGAYARSWLVFDIIVVVSDWLVVALKDSSTLSAVPVLRSLRLVRVLRLLRLGRLSHMINEILLYASDGVTLGVSVLKLTVGLCVGVHLVACVWYGVGDSNSSGWVSREALLESAAPSEQYLFSVHWVITQLQGTSLTPPRTILEIGFQSLVLLGAQAFVAIFIANLTQAMISLTDTQKLQMQQAARRYLRRRRISPALSYQVRAHFGKNSSGKVSVQDTMELEDKLVESLPLVLRQQLYEEVRLPLLKLVPLFRRDGFSNTRLLRQLCCKAISGVSLISGELVFSLGDACRQMLVVESGAGVYVKLKKSCETRSAFGRTLTTYLKEQASEESDMKQVIRYRGQHICEAALWTRWTNQGELFAEGDCTMLCLMSTEFATIVSAYETTRVLCLKYAACFVSWLNDRARMHETSDVMETPKQLIPEYLQKLADDSAFVFISHFKEEAGSDAALIEEGMRRIIKENPAHPAFNLRRPIFLDSNDLVETDHIRTTIGSSHNVVVLLTDNVLTRPWVLIEIVTALKARLPIHLVTIQRPGVDFRFPSETFLERLAAGEGLTPSARALLRAEGITAEDLLLLGNAFQRIALPFSPHKSMNVREAELLDIMNRCEISGSKFSFRRPDDLVRSRSFGEPHSPPAPSTLPR
ncbi:unnamed protein product [Prorocentrum cordatum]|uniref:Ion transport domain-containing protein n=1 Tax=Prorocentrum cordatum TaxID=2364126 RepID=A0ABN9W0S1_9DINO|nr:unnamed protein product [Polarella glacialis]